MKLIEYRPPPTAQKIATIVFIIALILRVVLLGLSLFAGFEVAGKVTLPLLNFIVLFAVLFLIKKRRVLFFLLTGVLILINAVYLLMSNDGAEYHFTSPQGQNTVVVREQSALLSQGWAKVYKREYGVLLMPLGEAVGTDDKYHPFSQGQYRIEWQDEDSAAIYYYDGHGYKQLSIEL